MLLFLRSSQRTECLPTMCISSVSFVSFILCVCYLVQSRKFKGEIVSFFTPVLRLWISGHIGSHLWRWIFRFGTIIRRDLCALTLMSDLLHTISIIHAWFSPRGKDNSCFLGWCSYEKSGGTITLLHIWPQDGCCNRSPLQFPWVQHEKQNFTLTGHSTIRSSKSMLEFHLWLMFKKSF